MRKLIIRFLAWLLAVVDPPASELYFTFSDHNTIHKVKHMNSTIIGMTPLVLAVLCADATGHAVKPDVTVSDPSLATAVLDEKGLLLTITPVGPLGKFTVTATSGALSASDDIEIVADVAVVLTLTEVAPAA